MGNREKHQRNHQDKDEIKEQIAHRAQDGGIFTQDNP
jgi:hypothetical protein